MPNEFYNFLSMAIAFFAVLGVVFSLLLAVRLGLEVIAWLSKKVSP